MAIGVRRIYGATALTGAASGALSDIDVGILKPNDMAIAKANDIPSPANPGHTDQFDGVYFYRFANVSTDEDVPKIIKPNNASGSGRWLLISPQYFMENIEVEPDKKVIVNEIVGNGSGLSLGWQDGTVDIVIGTSAITVTKDITTDSQIISTLAIGTAPFAVTSTTQVDNLNVQYISGNAITNLSRLNNNTDKYSVIPQVVNATTIYPTDDRDLVTKKYVDDVLAVGGSIDHGTLTGLADDDHTQYTLASGTRAFTGTVSGVAPTLSTHLATKGYVDGRVNPIATTYVKRDGSLSFTGIISGVTPTYGSAGPTNLVTVNYVGTAIANISHGSLLNLGSDDHTQYVLASGTRAFSGVVSGVTPTISAHLATKGYVDTGLTNITNVYVVRNGTIAFTGIPQVTNTLGVPDFGPTQPYHLATQEYVDSIVTGGSITHSSLSGLNVDDHTQYILASGTRAFGGAVSGVTPTIDAHLATKGYVDGVIVTSHTSLTNLTADDHTQYIRVDGLRVFDTTTYFPGVSNNGSVPDDIPTQPWDLATKEYVDDGVATLGSLELFDYVDIYGRHPIIKNQQYSIVTIHHPFNIAESTALVQKQYVDYYMKRGTVSSTDAHFDVFVNKVESDDSVVIDSTVVLGTDTGVVVQTTGELLGQIERVTITNGGSEFFVYDNTHVSYPRTFNNVWTTAGSQTNITETSVVLASDVAPNADADIAIRLVLGDIGYIEVIAGSTFGTTTGTFSFDVLGNTYDIATWQITLSSGAVTGIQQVSGGSLYTTANDIVDIPGVTGVFTLRPYVVGAITRFAINDGGDAYALGSYFYKGSAAVGGPDDDGFTWSGHGTTTGDVNDSNIDIGMINPVNEKVKWSHYTVGDVGTTPANLYTNDWSTTAGYTISGVTLDRWGHITGIDETPQTSQIWELKSADFELEYGKGYFVDIALVDVIVTLPDSGVTAPSIGDTFTIDDYKDGAESITPRYIRIQPHANQGGNLLVSGSSATPMDIDVAGTRVTFTYVDGTYGWRYKVI